MSQLPWVALKKIVAYLPVINQLKAQLVSKTFREFVLVNSETLTLDEYEMMTELRELGMLERLAPMEAFVQILNSVGSRVRHLTISTFKTPSCVVYTPNLADSLHRCEQLVSLKCRHASFAGGTESVNTDAEHGAGYEDKLPACLLQVLRNLTVLEAILVTEDNCAFPIGQVLAHVRTMRHVACVHVQTSQIADFHVDLAQNGPIPSLKGVIASVNRNSLNTLTVSLPDQKLSMNPMDYPSPTRALPTSFETISGSLKCLSIYLTGPDPISTDCLSVFRNLESLSVFFLTTNSETCCLNFLRAYPKLAHLRLASARYRFTAAQLQNVPPSAPLEHLELAWSFDQETLNLFATRKYPLKQLVILFGFLDIHSIVISRQAYLDLFNSCVASLETVRLIGTSDAGAAERQLLNEIDEKVIVNLKLIEIGSERGTMLDLNQFWERRKKLFVAGRTGKCRLFLSLRPGGDFVDLVRRGAEAGVAVELCQAEKDP